MEFDFSASKEFSGLISADRYNPIYQVYYHIYTLRTTTPKENTNYFIKYFHYLIKLWELLQTLSLILPLKQNRRNSQLEWFYVIFLGTRLEIMATKFNVELVNYILTAITILLPFLILILSILKSVKKSQPFSDSILKFCYSLPLSYSKNVIFISMLCSCLAPLLFEFAGE